MIVGERTFNMSEQFKIIETQEQFDAAISKRLAREREAGRKEAEAELSQKYGDYDSIKSQLTAKETELTELGNQLAEAQKTRDGFSAQIAELNGKIAKYETNSAKMRIAEEYGLDAKLADRISGDDEEAMRKDAQALKDIVGETRWRRAPLKSTEPEGDDNSAALKGMLQQLKGE